MLGKPHPVKLEALSMPANNCLALHEDQCPPPAGPKPTQHNLEQLVRNRKPRVRMLLFENAQLLTKSLAFEEQLVA
jgi:hypothetical protein